ncbi:hypothetical protein LRS05_00200 [Flavobacterium sp. J372]|uniref:hypothetical protein n=1 Tax=Flavobacterium sp. J372 TaxID=2898436 RepID=UPI00215147EB|nr:hypothetical protein [Flavobacterium sp. J372]MCR5860675.1 hypothetical protein [Flavobacterium sp. J372]
MEQDKKKMIKGEGVTAGNNAEEVVSEGKKRLLPVKSTKLKTQNPIPKKLKRNPKTRNLNTQDPQGAGP